MIANIDAGNKHSKHSVNRKEECAGRSFPIHMLQHDLFAYESKHSNLGRKTHKIFHLFIYFYFLNPLKQISSIPAAL